MKYLAFFRERPLTAAAVCYGAGILVAGSLAFSLLFSVIGAAVSLALFLIRLLKGDKRIAGACAALFFVGMLLTGIRMNPSVPESGKYTVRCTVTGTVAEEEDGRKKAYVTDVILIREDGDGQKAGNAYLTYTPKKEEQIALQDGTMLCLQGTVYHPSDQSNPFGFDFRQYLLTKGVGYGISCYGGAEVTGQKSNGISSVLYRIRSALYDRCRAVFGSESALPLALILGYRDDLPDETREAFSDAGVAHILAVSGLHVTLLAEAVLLFMKPFHLSPRARMALIGIFLAAYCVVTGFSAPVVRASVLTMIGMLAVVLRRRSDPLTTLSAAFLIILTVDPLQLYTASFILSFSAVAGIIVFGDLFETLNPTNRLLNRIWKWWRMTFAATLGVALPTILYFHTFSVAGLLINPLVCAVIGVLLPLYAVIYVIGCAVLPVGAFLGNLIAPVTSLFTESVTRISRLPYASVRIGTPGFLSMIFLIGALVVLTRYVLIGKRKKIAACAVCLAGFALSMLLQQDHSLRYVQLALGQEDSAVLIDDRQVIVIDTGESGSDLSSYLMSMGLRADSVVISHMHMDHLGGIQRLIDDHIPIGCVYIPEGAECFAGYEAMRVLERLSAEGIPVKTLSRGDRIATKRAEATVLWPEKDSVHPGGDANDYALSLMIDLDGVKLLNMTDVSGVYEKYSASPADILKVSHHGSRTSTGEEFLQKVCPENAIITCTDRSASLPSAETLERFEAAGVTVYRTDETGALTVRCKDGKYEIETFRGVR